jgi:hypothetical protein
MKRHVYYLIIKNFNFINNNYLSSQTSEHNNTKNGILAWERYTMWHSGLGKVCNVAFWLGKGIQCGILAWERYTMWHSGLGRVYNVAFWLGKGIQCGILAWERYTMWHPGLGKVYNVAFWLGKGIQCGGLNRLMGCHVNTFGLWKPFIGRLIIV